MKRPKQRCLLFLLPVGLALAGAFSVRAQTDPSAIGKTPVNVLCPVQTDEPIDPNITTTYHGEVIAFCCEQCRRKFEADPERYADRLAALSEPNEAGVPDDSVRHEDDVHDHSRAHGGEPDRGEPHNDEPGETNAGHEHDHAGGDKGLSAVISWLGNFHPPAVNFPIAMIIGAALAEGLWVALKREFFVNAGRFCLWVGGIGAIVAGVLGWFFGGFHLTDESWIMTTHRWLGTATVICALLTLVVGEHTFRSPSDSNRVAYRVLLLFSAFGVLVTGFFGGAMVYGINHYAW